MYVVLVDITNTIKITRKLATLRQSGAAGGIRVFTDKRAP